MAKHQSVADMYRARVKASADKDAFEFRSGGGWKTLSWAQSMDRVRAVASGLRALGLEDEQRVGILCSTRIEWLFADLGVMCAGGATTTIYPSSPADICEFILTDSGSRIVIAENDDQVAKLVEVRAAIPEVVTVVNIDGKGGHEGWVIGWDELVEKGKAYDAEDPARFDATIDRITPDKLATLIYTSGTTGTPKGVELVNDCWLYIGEAIQETGFMQPDDKQFLWLPLSHSFGKALEVIVIQLGIPTAIDGEIPKIVANLAEVRPTFMGAAPRIFEKVYNKVLNGAKQAGGLKWKLVRWAATLAPEISKVKQSGREPSGLLALKYKIVDKLVYSKLRALFGGRVRYLISGSAPLNRDIAEFFHAAGLTILEGYGLTESSAASFVNTPDSNKFGTVGKPLPGTEVRIAKDTGEIQFRSRGVMRGYYKLGDKSAETLDEGWLCTGDKGELDADGHLRITDRIKNLIKTSGGKYVAPAMIEGKFVANCPLAAHIIVHGNARNFCSALVTMDPEAIQAWAENNGKSGKSYADLAKDPAVIAEFQTAMDATNHGLGRWETVKKFALLPNELTIEGGELTPSMKVKRKAVEAKYKDVLDGFYAGALADV